MKSVDIFITTTDRPGLLMRSLRSFRECTHPSMYRLTVVQDGSNVETNFVLDEMQDERLSIEHLLVHSTNLGLGPSINQALAHIDSLKKWDGDDAPPFTLYLQDDIAYSPGWLERLIQMFIIYEETQKVAFASGIEGPEHPIKKRLGDSMVLKDAIRATCMLARHETWMSMWPISRIDPETGRERGRPHDGLGSGVDWHFVRVHENSVCKTNRTCLVIPGLLQHMGYANSTWYRGELPESSEDKRKIADVLQKNSEK